MEVVKIESEVINTNPAQYAFKVESGTDDFGTKIYRKEIYTVDQLESMKTSQEANIVAMEAEVAKTQEKLDAIAELG